MTNKLFKLIDIEEEYKMKKWVEEISWQMLWNNKT